MTRIEFFGISGSGKSTRANAIVRQWAGRTPGTRCVLFQHPRSRIVRVAGALAVFARPAQMREARRALSIIESAFPLSAGAVPRWLNLIREATFRDECGDVVVFEESLVQGCWTLMDRFGGEPALAVDAALALARLAGGKFVFVDLDPAVALVRLRRRGRAGRLEEASDMELLEKLTGAREFFRDAFDRLSKAGLIVHKAPASDVEAFPVNELVAC